MANMTIISPGPLSTIQDMGRFGYMGNGFSPSGAMDSYSMRKANILVGNSPYDGVVEMTFMGMSVCFDAETVIAVTGADMEAELNGQKINMYESVGVASGDILSFKQAKQGMRTYLAVAGGFDIKPVMGSMSTNIKCSLGGFKGRKLRAGDVIALRQSIPHSLIGKRCTKADSDYRDELEIRVLTGPQDDYFTDNGLKTFFDSEYIVSEKSDRMGIRLDGNAIESKSGADIISDGIVTGSVQITPSGSPIIMMADRQTTGGYAKIATVISVDIKRIAQARPGTKIKFKRTNEKDAIRLLKKEEMHLRKLQYKMMFSRWKD